MTPNPSRLVSFCSLLILCNACLSDTPQTSSLLLKPCRPEGFTEELRCGALERLENPADPSGRRIFVQLVVLPARASHPKPDPLYVIAGGPGQSARSAGKMLGTLFSQVRKQRDVVLVDQRGTGESNPLTCETADEGTKTKSIAARLMEDERGDTQALADCLRALQEKVDPRFYGTSPALDDLDAVRVALGHRKINLWGISYGTRVALAYLGRYEKNVRSVTLDAVVPPDVILPAAMATGAERALEMTFDDCAQSPECAQAFPELEARFLALAEQLQASPLMATSPDPRTGEPEEVRITGDTFTSIVRNLLYDPDIASLLPLTLTQLERGDPRGFLAQASALTNSTGVAEGMHMTVFCSEDFARFSDEPVQPVVSKRKGQEALGRDLFGRHVMDGYRKSCALWPSAQVPATLFEPVSSSVPVLILSGALDPVTPPEFGERVKKTLSNSRHVVAPGGAHGVTLRGCTSKVIARFIEKPLPAVLDVGCIEEIRRRPFFLTFAGPRP